VKIQTRNSIHFLSALSNIQVGRASARKRSGVKIQTRSSIPILPALRIHYSWLRTHSSGAEWRLKHGVLFLFCGLTLWEYILERGAERSEDSNTEFFSHSVCFENTFILNIYAFERSGVKIQTPNSIHFLPDLRMHYPWILKIQTRSSIPVLPALRIVSSWICTCSCQL